MMRNSKIKKDLHIHHVIDMYKEYVRKQLESNSRLYTVYDRVLCIKGLHLLCKKNYQGQEEIVMSYTIFRSILEKCNSLIIQAILTGEKFYFGHSLGYIEGSRIERNFEKKKVNYKATKLLRESSGNPEAVVYHTDNTYCRIAWKKLRTLANSVVYEFTPAKHVKNTFSTTLTSNPSLQFLFTLYKRR